MKTRELKGMPIVTLQEGERLGHVRNLIVDPAAVQVVALLLDRRSSGGERLVVATANIHKVGSTAITVENRSSMVPLSRIPRFQELVQSRGQMRGKMVITESGARLGKIAELEIDPETFAIQALLLKGFMRRGRQIPAGQVRTIGPDAVVVREEAAIPRPAVVPRVPPATEPPPPAPKETPLEPVLPEEEPAVPPVSVLDKTPPVPPEEPAGEIEEPVEELLEPAAEATAPVAEEPLEKEPAETAPAETVEEAAAEGPENPWQRWVRRIRHRGEEEAGE